MFPMRPSPSVAQRSGSPEGERRSLAVDVFLPFSERVNVLVGDHVVVVSVAQVRRTAALEADAEAARRAALDLGEGPRRLRTAPPDCLVSSYTQTHGCARRSVVLLLPSCIFVTTPTAPLLLYIQPPLGGVAESLTVVDKRERGKNCLKILI